MPKLDDAKRRSAVIAARLQQRTDLALRDLIDNFDGELDFHPLDEFMISEKAWNYVNESSFNPKSVFAHPSLLYAHPEASAYYRGVALLSRKRVSDLAGSVESWEERTRKSPVRETHLFRVVRLYNAVISSIIEGSNSWTLENGYRNIIANMGIGLDGTVRNIIGQDAEQLVKTRIKNWLCDRGLIIECDAEETRFSLVKGYSMRYGSEPDIEFRKSEDSEIVSTIEIKGGKDPAGALERLGAIQKSFQETPPGSVNMLIAGVITTAMQERLTSLGISKVFLLDDLTSDSAKWIEFLNEVFHYTIRITKATISEE